MTATRRSYLIIGALTIGAVCTFGQAVEHWTIAKVFGFIAVGANTLAGGLAKSPRDAKISDEEAAKEA